MVTIKVSSVNSLERAKEIRRSNDGTGMLDYRCIDKRYRAHELAKQICKRLENKGVK